MALKNLTPLNGFDKADLQNAKQNNYAWSMCELGDYIYVGTCKNMGLTMIDMLTSSFGEINMPLSLSVDCIDSRGEIWRYKKDGMREWERVYKLKNHANNGFRYMINFTPYNARTALLAASASLNNTDPIKVVMTYDGIVWKEVQGRIKGYSSRSMEVHNGKIYIATSGRESKPYLYSNSNPEVSDWKTVLDSSTEGYDPSKNPNGTIFNIKSFNNHLYVGINSENGAEVWRSIGTEPSMNEWIKIGESGYGDPNNKLIISMNVFKDNLYFSTIGKIPDIFLIPRGADLIRVDKDDNYEVIVGNRKSRSGYLSGFNNPLNLYFWQLCEYKGELYVTTFDHGSNIQTLLEIILLNEDLVNEYLRGAGYAGVTADNIESALKMILKVLDEVNYQYGFDLFISHDGVNFRPAFLNGLGNDDNYGGRLLYVDSRDHLYLGTANPYEGLEVYRSEVSLRSNGCMPRLNCTPNLEVIGKIKEMEDLFNN